MRGEQFRAVDCLRHKYRPFSLRSWWSPADSRRRSTIPVRLPAQTGNCQTGNCEVCEIVVEQTERNPSSAPILPFVREPGNR